MEENEKNKILIGSIILVITLILVVVGTTYAFFSLQVQNSSEPTNIEITTGEQNKITLNGGLTNYHIHLKVSDMSLDNVGKSYYGTTDTDKDYEIDELSGTQELGNISVNGELTDEYVCTSTINIALEGEMQEHLQQNDLILVIKQGDTTNTYDLSEAISNPTFKFNISSSTIEPIKAYLKFTNQNTDQSLLAGKELNITISINDFACEIKVVHPNVKLLQEKGKDTFKEQSGMYRFIGTKDEVANNYICFGTDDTETCTKTPEDYMYRIIGMTSDDDNTINLPANSLKIIKAIPLDNYQEWHNSYEGDIEWDDADIKTYLNGTGNNQFLGTVKWESPAYWKGLITSQKWYNAVQSTKPGATEEPTSSQTSNSYQIGLMYVTDYKNSGAEDTNNWLFIKNGWSTNTTLSGLGSYEWTMSKSSHYTGSVVHSFAWLNGSDGHLRSEVLTNNYSVRPVFYVDPNITLTGEGSTENPFIIHTT